MQEIEKIRKLLRLAGALSAPDGERLSALNAAIRVVESLDITWHDFCDAIDSAGNGAKRGWAEDGTVFHAAKTKGRESDDAALRAWFAAFQREAGIHATPTKATRKSTEFEPTPGLLIRFGEEDELAEYKGVATTEDLTAHNDAKFREAETMMDVVDGSGMREGIEDALRRTGRTSANVFDMTRTGDLLKGVVEKRREIEDDN